MFDSMWNGVIPAVARWDNCCSVLPQVNTFRLVWFRNLAFPAQSNSININSTAKIAYREVLTLSCSFFGENDLIQLVHHRKPMEGLA